MLQFFGKQIMKKRLSLLLTAIFAFLLVALAACDKPLPEVDYGKDNDFETSIEDGEDSLIFSPKGATPAAGLIFYVGTMISEQNYKYLGEALAREGYLAVFPKVMFAFYNYRDSEPALERFKDVRFFLGGHSQGGGAAIRRAQEDPERTEGLILLAPLCFDYDGAMFEGDDVKDFYNVADAEIPSLILRAEGDRVLSAAQTAASSMCVNKAFCEEHEISPGAHMSFSTADNDSVLKFFNNDGDGISEQDKKAQRDATVRFVLAFMKRVTRGEFML